MARTQGGEAQGKDRKILLLGRGAVRGDPDPGDGSVDRLADRGGLEIGLQKVPFGGNPRRPARRHDHDDHLLRDQSSDLKRNNKKGSGLRFRSFFVYCFLIIVIVKRISATPIRIIARIALVGMIIPIRPVCIIVWIMLVRV